MGPSRWLRPALAAAAALAGTGTGAAPAATFRAEYGISLAGLPLASAEVVSVLEGTTYRTQIQARTTGLAGLVAGGKGAATATGSLAGGQPLPATFAVASRSAKSQINVNVALAQGNVAQVEIAPPLEPRPDRVPLQEAHKRGVVDPVSAILVPVHGRGEATDPSNCNRTIPVFDGASRFDVVLAPAGARHAETPGYRGPVIVCTVRYVPLSGHRPERPGTKFMMQNRDISVWLAPIAGTRLLAPVRISLMTLFGTSVVEATRFAVGDGTVRAGAAPR